MTYMYPITDKNSMLLRTGDTIRGEIKLPKEVDKYFPLVKVNKINGRNSGIR